MAEQTTAELLEAARQRAYADGYTVPEARPTMIAFDLSDGMTHNVARCCGTPVPVMAEPTLDSKNQPGGWHADLSCAQCGQTLAVLRWKLPKRGDEQPRA